MNTETQNELQPAALFECRRSVDTNRLKRVFQSMYNEFVLSGLCEGEEDPEGSGDLNLLSVWTAPEYRRMGIASALLDKALEVAAALYDYEEGQYRDDITLKTMYCLSDGYRKSFEEWLMKNDFTELGILKSSDGERPEVCSASADIHFFRTIG